MASEAIIATGVGDALAGDVRRTAVDGLVERLAFPALCIRRPSDAEGSMPSEPVSMAAMSESTSPKRLSVTMTSNCFGARTSCIAPASASM